MKQTHTCPKCQSKELYTNSGNVKRGERCSLPVTSWTSLFVDIYICLNCGFVEEYITDKELHNIEKMNKVKSEFKKVI